MRRTYCQGEHTTKLFDFATGTPPLQSSNVNHHFRKEKGRCDIYVFSNPGLLQPWFLAKDFGMDGLPYTNYQGQRTAA